MPAELLARLIADLPVSDPQLLVGPTVGEDAAVIDWAAETDVLLVAKSDPITFATDAIWYYAVNVCVNDLAVTGATPRFYLPTVLLPADQADVTTLVERIFTQIGTACREAGVVVAGGHSEITSAVNQPVLAGTMLGTVDRSAIVPTSGARPGDLILMAGGYRLKGSALLRAKCNQR